MKSYYMQKPYICEAVKWNGENLDEVMALGLIWVTRKGRVLILRGSTNNISTAQPGDYIVKGRRNDIRVCPAAKFREVYGPA